MKFFHNIYIAFIVLVFSIGIFIFSIYHYAFSGTSNEEILETVVIEPGSISSIATSLKEKKFIRSELAFKVYVKLANKNNLKAGTYSLSKDMGLIEVVNILEEGNNFNDKEIQILFKEGLNMRKITKAIVDNTNNTEDMVYGLIEDKEYLNSLIDEYWFISDDILDSDIYYSLEGYLFPSTYSFSSKDVSVKDIFKTMLDEMEKQLNSYKENINNSDKNFHELLTLASIVELEGVSLEDRKGIASVLYNRLDKNMSLGCDVTTYYGARVDMSERDLYSSELKECNGYNTRCTTFKGLPISPIANPSLESIIAVLEPVDEDYLYFVADKNRKVYFNKNLTGHNNTIAKLKREGLWYEY